MQDIIESKENDKSKIFEIDQVNADSLPAVDYNLL